MKRTMGLLRWALQSNGDDDDNDMIVLEISNSVRCNFVITFYQRRFLSIDDPRSYEHYISSSERERERERERPEQEVLFRPFSYYCSIGSHNYD